MNDGMAIEFIHGSHETILEFLFGCNADVAQHRARELGEEDLDEIEPGAMRGREGEFEAADRLTGKPSLGLFGDVCGMIVQDQLDCRVGWIGGVEKLEKLDEFAAAMTIPDESVKQFIRVAEFFGLTTSQIRSTDAAEGVGRMPRLGLYLVLQSGRSTDAAEGDSSSSKPTGAHPNASMRPQHRCCGRREVRRDNQGEN